MANETLAERIKKAAIQSVKRHKELNLIDEDGKNYTSVANKKAIEICGKLGIINQILKYIEVSGNAYKNEIVEWKISLYPSYLMVDSSLRGAYSYDGSSCVIDLSKQKVTASILREMSEVIYQHLNKYVIVYSSYREYGKSVTNPILQIRMKRNHWSDVITKSLNENATEVLEKLNLSLNIPELTNEQIEERARMIALNYWFDIVEKQLEEAAFFGAKHIKIISGIIGNYSGGYYYGIDKILFVLTGTPERLNDRCIYVKETNDLDFYTLHYKKGKIIEYIFDLIKQHFEKLGFIVEYAKPSGTTVRTLIIQLFTQKDIKNDK